MNTVEINVTIIKTKSGVIMVRLPYGNTYQIVDKPCNWSLLSGLETELELENEERKDLEKMFLKP